MGQIVSASCRCGYDEKFTIGGTRSSYRTHSYFPYRCEICGIVEVNIASMWRRCPNSVFHKIARLDGGFYERVGRIVIRNLLGLIGLRKPKPMPQVEEKPKPWVTCEWGNHKIYEESYQCPACGNSTLTFEKTGIRFD